jgi:hypothetical protein
MLPVTDTIEKGARLELPQIIDSIIDEIICELKRFPPGKAYQAVM